MNLDKLERIAKAAQCPDGKAMFSGHKEHEAYEAAFLPDVVLGLIARIREYERRHPDSACMVNIGKKAGYWDCTCEPGFNDAGKP